MLFNLLYQIAPFIWSCNIASDKQTDFCFVVKIPINRSLRSFYHKIVSLPALYIANSVIPNLCYFYLLAATVFGVERCSFFFTVYPDSIKKTFNNQSLTRLAYSKIINSYFEIFEKLHNMELKSIFLMFLLILMF